MGAWIKERLRLTNLHEQYSWRLKSHVLLICYSSKFKSSTNFLLCLWEKFLVIVWILDYIFEDEIFKQYNLITLQNSLLYYYIIIE